MKNKSKSVSILNLDPRIPDSGYPTIILLRGAKTNESGIEAISQSDM